MKEIDPFSDLNDRYSLSIPKDGEYGTEVTNGSWSGIIGMVLNKVSQFS